MVKPKKITTYTGKILPWASKPYRLGKNEWYFVYGPFRTRREAIRSGIAIELGEKNGKNKKTKVHDAK